MSNYPNMSYCMCGNTVLAMRQILDAMQEEGPMFLHDMNREERRAFQELFHLAEQFCNESEELEDEYERAVREGTLNEYMEDTE